MINKLEAVFVLSPSPAIPKVKIHGHSVLQNNPTEIIDQDDKSDIGGFSRFRIPLLIIGAGGLLLMIYLYKESFNQLLFIGGSLISALGLIGKLMDTYKK
jgi:hypothetical protein